MTTTLRVELRRPPLTANDQRRAHWSAVRKAKAQVHLLVVAQARAQRVGRVPGPVVVTATWHAPDARVRDSDSMAPFLKASLDALVAAGVLPTDDHRWVQSSGHTIVVDRADPHLAVTITPAVTP